MLRKTEAWTSGLAVRKEKGILSRDADLGGKVGSTVLTDWVRKLRGEGARGMMLRFLSWLEGLQHPLPSR